MDELRTPENHAARWLSPFRTPENESGGRAVPLRTLESALGLEFLVPSGRWQA